MEWLFCDAQLMFYLKVGCMLSIIFNSLSICWQNFKAAMFPEKPEEPAAVRTKEVKRATRDEVRCHTCCNHPITPSCCQALERLLGNLPAVLITLVGQKQGRLGVEKLFHSFQNLHSNKHMCYIVLEALLYKLFPEVPQRDLVAAFVCA